MHPDEKRIGASNRRHLAWRQRNTVPWRRHRGGGAAAVGAVHGGGVGTEGATSSADAVGYRRGRRRVRRWCGQRGWCAVLPMAAVWAPPPLRAAIHAQMRRNHRRRTVVRSSLS